MLENGGWATRIGEAEVGDGDDARVRHGFPSDGNAVWFIIRESSAVTGQAVGQPLIVRLRLTGLMLE